MTKLIKLTDLDIIALLLRKIKTIFKDNPTLIIELNKFLLINKNNFRSSDSIIKSYLANDTDFANETQRGIIRYYLTTFSMFIDKYCNDIQNDNTKFPILELFKTQSYKLPDKVNGKGKGKLSGGVNFRLTRQQQNVINTLPSILTIFTYVVAKDKVYWVILFFIVISILNLLINNNIRRRRESDNENDDDLETPLLEIVVDPNSNQIIDTDLIENIALIRNPNGELWIGNEMNDLYELIHKTLNENETNRIELTGGKYTIKIKQLKDFLKLAKSSLYKQIMLLLKNKDFNYKEYTKLIKEIVKLQKQLLKIKQSTS
jgi:hypothetical protein